MKLQENISRIREMMGLNETLDQNTINDLWLKWKTQFENTMKELPETSGVTVNLDNFTDDNPIEILVDGKPFINGNMSFGFVSHLQDTDKMGIGDLIVKVENFITNNFNNSVFNKLRIPKKRKDEIYNKMIQASTDASNTIRNLV